MNENDDTSEEVIFNPRDSMSRVELGIDDSELSRYKKTFSFERENIEGVSAAEENRVDRCVNEIGDPSNLSDFAGHFGRFMKDKENPSLDNSVPLPVNYANYNIPWKSDEDPNDSNSMMDDFIPDTSHLKFGGDEQVSGA